MNAERAEQGRAAGIGRTILIGFFTVAPLWVTWLVFDFLLGILAGMGKPLLRTAARAVMPFSETLAIWLPDSDFQKLVAVLLTLAAVYVPTSPNPTSGYIEIVPLDEVVPTDWTMEEAMTFVMTGGANAPDRVRFSGPGAVAPADDEAGTCALTPHVLCVTWAEGGDAVNAFDNVTGFVCEV